MNGQKDNGLSPPTQLDRIEWMLHQLLAESRGGQKSSLPAGGPAMGVGPRGEPVLDGLPYLTVKQHATMQLLMEGMSNLDIANVLGVTDNTVKVHVRTIARKMGVKTRNQISLRAYAALEEMSEEEYSRLSGGLLKTWGAYMKAAGPSGWKSDPLAHLYRNDVGDADGCDDEAD